MKIKQITETTTSGSIATVDTALGGTQSRGNPSIYGGKKVGSLFKGKKTKAPYANSINESADLSEAHLEEDDVIVVPGQGRSRKNGFVPHGQSRVDHEVEMARSDLFSAAKNAQQVYSMIKDVSEEEGLDGWVQEKIIKANDYLNTIREYLEGKQVQGVAEGWQEDSQELEDWSKEVNKRLYRAHESQRPALARQLSKLEQKNFGSNLNQGSLTELVHSALKAIQKGQMVHYDPQSVGQMPFGSMVGDDARIIAAAGVSSDELVGYRMLSDKGIVDNIKQFLQLRRVVWNKNWPTEYLEKFKGNPGALWLQFVKDLGWSKDDMNEEVQAKTDDKLLAYYAQRKAEKQKQVQSVAEGKRNLKCVCKTQGTMQCPVHTPKDIEVIENNKNKKA